MAYMKYPQQAGYAVETDVKSERYEEIILDQIRAIRRFENMIIYPEFESFFIQSINVLNNLLTIYNDKKYKKHKKIIFLDRVTTINSIKENNGGKITDQEMLKIRVKTAKRIFKAALLLIARSNIVERETYGVIKV